MIDLRKALLYSFLFALCFSYALLLPNRVSDINLHSAAAHIGYKIVVENDAELSENFGVDFFKPASVYHVFYILSYIFIKDSWLIAFLFHFLYFFMWGIASFFLLKQVGKAVHNYFFAMLLLSLNPGVFFSMPAFMASEVAYLFILAFSIRQFNKSRQNILLYAILPAVAVFHFLHPYTGIIAVITLAFYANLQKSLKFKLAEFFVSAVLGIALLFLLSYFSIYSSGAPESASILLENPEFFIKSFFLGKISQLHVILNMLIFLAYLPLFIYFISVRQYSLHIKMFYVIALLFIILPDDFGNAFNMSGRLFVFGFLFLVLSSKDDEIGTRLLGMISLACIFMSLIYIVYPEEIKEIAKQIPGFKDAFNFFEDKSQQTDKELFQKLSSLEIKKIYAVSADPFYGSEFNQIDQGIISSNAYFLSSHPVYSKTISPFYENFNNFLRIYGNGKKAQEETCRFAVERTNAICSVYTHVLSKDCAFSLTELYSLKEGNSTFFIYKC